MPSSEEPPSDEGLGDADCTVLRRTPDERIVDGLPPACRVPDGVARPARAALDATNPSGRLLCRACDEGIRKCVGVDREVREGRR
mmetsp:Transcript_83113/g.225232  ORF Transcript_83113/g.225232 Transcript_83113/m.225232 type:complete len:85 (+) Transcript_83113:181-435(+)